MQYTLYYNEHSIPYRIVSSKKRKHLAITIDRIKGVCVRVPLGIDMQYVHNWVDSKKEWIATTVARCNYLQPFTKQPLDSLQYLGITYPLHIKVANRNRITIHNDVISIYTMQITQEYIQQYLVKWLRRKASAVFTQLYHKCLQEFIVFCNQYCPHQTLWYGRYKATVATFIRPKLRIYSMKRKYGTLGQNHLLTLSTRLIHAPVECIEFVIFHELAHIIEFNHSTRFYDILTTLCPQWQQYHTWLIKKLIPL